jgi:hypothetical protein
MGMPRREPSAAAVESGQEGYGNEIATALPPSYGLELKSKGMSSTMRLVAALAVECMLMASGIAHTDRKVMNQQITLFWAGRAAKSSKCNVQPPINSIPEQNLVAKSTCSLQQCRW